MSYSSEPAPSLPNRRPSQASPSITAIVLTRNEEASVGECLDSLSWTTQQIVFDSHSEDDTRAVAAEHGATVIQHQFTDFASQRNAALDQTSGDFVFFIDADERVPEKLAAEIVSTVAAAGHDAWYLPRHNYIFGRLTLGAGWYPDYQLRLFRRGKVRYQRPVHEIAEVNGTTGYLENPLTHINYKSVEEFQRKQADYVKYDVDELRRLGTSTRFYTPLTQAGRQFWWRFVSLKGYRDGLHGLRLSVMMARYEYIKYGQLAAPPA